MSETEQDNIHGINITPLVDVSLVLVLIFMVTMPLSMIHGIDVKRQTLKKYGLSTPQENIVVSLTPKGLSIRDKGGTQRAVPETDFEQVLGGMVEQSAKKRLLLSADKNVEHGRTVWVMDAAKRSGVVDITLLGKD